MSSSLSKELSEECWCEFIVINFNTNNKRFSIYVTPPTSGNKLYFKVLDRDWNNSIKCARISLLKPEYIHCSDCELDEWILNDQEKKDLVDVLQTKIYLGEMTYWQYLTDQYDFQTKFLPNYNPNIINLPMPDYMKL